MSEAAARLEGQARSVGVSLLGLAVQVTGPAYHALLAHAVGTGGYGLFAWSTSALDVLSILVLFGMDLVVRRRVSEALVHGREGDVHGTVAAALRAVLGAGAALVAAMFALAPWIAAWTGHPELTGLLRVLALGPLLFHTATVLLCALQGAHDMARPVYVRSAVQPVALFGCIAAVAWLRPGLAETAGAIVTASAVTTTAAAWVYHRRFGLGTTLRALLERAPDPEQLRLGRNLAYGGILWAALARLDVLVFGTLASPREVGVFVGCVVFASALPQTRGALEPFLTTTLATSFEQGDLSGLRQSVQRVTRWFALFAGGLLVIFAGFGDGVLRLLGPDFPSGTPVLLVLLLGQLVAGLATSSVIVPLRGETRFFAGVAAGCIVLEIALLVALVPRFGALGAAVGSALATAAGPLALALRARARWSLQPLRWELVKPAIAAALAVAAGRAGLSGTDGPLLLRFGVGLGIAALLYPLLLGALGLHPEDRSLLARVAGRLRSRGGASSDPR